jgi:hypothetical protein
MNVVASLLCLALILVILIAAGTIFLLAPNRKNDTRTTAARSIRKSNQSWKSWIPYIVVMLILSIWSVLAGVFFLAVVWIMRQNPNPESSFVVGDAEKRTAQRVYTWLFLSSLITVPVFLYTVIASYSTTRTSTQNVLAALLPLVFHLPLLAGLTSKSGFVYRHTQQGILLIAVRAGLAAMAIGLGKYPEDGLWLFLLGNGSLWLFGSIWGWAQVSRADYWWMKGQRGTLTPGQQADGPPGMGQDLKLTPEQYIEYSKWYRKRERNDLAKDYALQAFRRGDPQIRRQAVRVLDDLNEVEFF